jgi:hypothetical protein
LTLIIRRRSWSGSGSAACETNREHQQGALVCNFLSNTPSATWSFSIGLWHRDRSRSGTLTGDPRPAAGCVKPGKPGGGAARSLEECGRPLDADRQLFAAGLEKWRQRIAGLEALQEPVGVIR